MCPMDRVDSERDRVEASSWEAAEAYGFDMSLIEANLRQSPAERIRRHARILALALALRQQMQKRRAGP